MSCRKNGRSSTWPRGAVPAYLLADLRRFVLVSTPIFCAFCGEGFPVILLSNLRRHLAARFGRPAGAPSQPGTAPQPLDAADAAEQVLPIETCQPTAASFAGAGGPALHAAANNPFHAWSTAPATLKMYRFRDVVLDRTHMVLLQHGRIIKETNYLQPEAALAALRVNPQTLIRPKITGAAATCFDHWDTNYYHWIAHSVPTLHAILQRQPEAATTLILPKLTPWQTETIALLGAADLPAMQTEPGEQYFFPVVEYYDIVAGRADFAISPLARAAYASMAANLPPPTRPHRKIYIERGANLNRNMPNEPALAARLRARGYETIMPERLSVAGQIALFQHASIVVAQLGAGLANIAFCQPGAIVYELLPSHHQNPCFLAMAMQGGLHYWGDVFETGVAASDHTSAWTADIDIDRVMQRLDELERFIK
jgi:capsular polysaccharide biosynthesis protein